MYRYETHLHTFPVSGCGKASVRESVEFYKEIGYDGIFITNHFYGATNEIKSYDEYVEYFFSACDEGKKIGEEIGIKVFSGAEISHGGSDFLIYGLDKSWYLAHPEIMDMEMSEKLPFLKESGALVIHAHPFREAYYIDHIRLYPRCVHGVEVINACRSELENNMADIYAENYGLLKTAGSDNHRASGQKLLAGLEFDTPLTDEQDFIKRIKNGQIKIFTLEN